MSIEQFLNIEDDQIPPLEFEQVPFDYPLFIISDRIEILSI